MEGLVGVRSVQLKRDRIEWSTLVGVNEDKACGHSGQTWGQNPGGLGHRQMGRTPLPG